MKECIFIDNITSWKTLHLFTVTTPVSFNLTKGEISVMATPTGPNAKILLWFTYLLINLLTQCSRVLLEKLTGSAASQEFPRIYMETGSSLPYSQVPATCPYPGPTPSILHPLPLPEDPS